MRVTELYPGMLLTPNNKNHVLVASNDDTDITFMKRDEQNIYAWFVPHVVHYMLAVLHIDCVLKSSDYVTYLGTQKHVLNNSGKRVNSYEVLHTNGNIYCVRGTHFRYFTCVN